MGDKYRMRCIGTSDLWDQFRDGTVLEMPKGCGWRGIRTDQGGCECYDIWRAYCRPLAPGPGCPRGIDWSCPRCKGSVTGARVERRAVANA